MTRPTAPAPPGWDFLVTAEGIARLEEVAVGLASGVRSAALGARLRSEGVGPDRVAALLTQAALRRDAVAKFGPLAGRFLFTRAGLEQATRAQVAAGHAERFRRAGCNRVWDLGCGIGADSVAVIAAGLSPQPVELDPLTARIASHNLAVIAHDHGRPSPRVLVGDAEELAVPERGDGVFLDPARRTAGHQDTRRIADPRSYSPSLEFALDWGSRFATGVKLGPGAPRELIPACAEAQWVSVDGQAVEMGLWFGAAARAGVRRSALVLRDGERAELVAASEAPDAEVRPLGAVLIEPDPAVIRARLIGALAERLGAGMLSPGIAYLTADAEMPGPFAAVFRVLEEVPVRERELRRALAAREIGTLEIKKRGADVDPAALRARLRLRGPRRATLILTRAGSRHVALLAERVRHHAAEPPLRAPAPG